MTLEKDDLVNDDPFKSPEILPAWFTGRMMNDSWSFGLLTITGQIIALERIDNISQDANGTIWLDATMLDSRTNLFGMESFESKIFVSPTERTQISINASHVVAAFELADT
jgi:hypothetical protein